MRMHLTVLLAGFLALALSRAATAADIVDTAIAGKFNTLVAAVKAAGLVDTLKGPGPFTVFAPTDEAFAKLPEGALADLLKPENKAKLQSVLTYHVIPGKVMARDAVKLNSAKTAQGSSINIKAIITTYISIASPPQGTKEQQLRCEAVSVTTKDCRPQRPAPIGRSADAPVELAIPRSADTWRAASGRAVPGPVLQTRGMRPPHRTPCQQPTRGTGR